MKTIAKSIIIILMISICQVACAQGMPNDTTTFYREKLLGKNGTTSTQNDYIYGLMVLKKTDAGKQLETAQQQLSCNCATCSSTGCDSCSDSLYYNYW